MPITLDGTVALESSAVVVNTFPRSYVTYVAGATGLNKFWIPVGQHSADWNSWEGAVIDNWTDSKQALTQPVGNSPALANKTSAPHIPVGSTVALIPVVAVFTSATSRTIYCGDNNPVSENSAVSDVSPNLAVFMAGNGLKGQIAETHAYNSALSAANVAALVAGTVKPEELAGWVDGWDFKTRTSNGVYTSMGGTRQLTVDASKTSVGTSAHPVARAGGGDTTPPTLTGSITVGTVAATTIQITWPAGADDSAVTSYETSTDGTNWADRGNVLTYTFSGLTANTSYTLRVRAKDAAGNVSSALSVTQSTAASSDPTAPVMSGSVTASSITQTSYTISGWSATDNVAVTGYEVSLNGGTSYTGIGTATSYNVTGRTAGTTDAVRVRAFDAAGNRATALSASVNLLAAPGAARLTTGTLRNNTGSVIPDSTGWTVEVSHPTTGVLIVQKTGLALVSGVITFTDASMTLAANYAWEAIHPTYGRILPLATTT